MKIFKGKKIEKIEERRYCKNKKCKCELRKNNDGDYCNSCQTKRDERRGIIVSAVGGLLLTGITIIINPKKIISKILGVK